MPWGTTVKEDFRILYLSAQRKKPTLGAESMLTSFEKKGALSISQTFERDPLSEESLLIILKGMFQTEGKISQVKAGKGEI